MDDWNISQDFYALTTVLTGLTIRFLYEFSLPWYSFCASGCVGFESFLTIHNVLDTISGYELNKMVSIQGIFIFKYSPTGLRLDKSSHNLARNWVAIWLMSSEPEKLSITLTWRNLIPNALCDVLPSAIQFHNLNWAVNYVFNSMQRLQISKIIRRAIFIHPMIIIFTNIIFKLFPRI